MHHVVADRGDQKSHRRQTEWQDGH
jgi:hypothetical protein